MTTAAKLANKYLDFDFEKQPKDILKKCPICDASGAIPISKHDKYNFPVTYHLCMTCGAAYQNPRMTQEAYNSFYSNGIYRKILMIKKIEENPKLAKKKGPPKFMREKMERVQSNYAKALVGGFLVKHVPKRGASLDIGGSLGKVAIQTKSLLKMDAYLLEPGAYDVQRARKNGLSAIHGLVESHDFKGKKFELILLCKTIDHLLDVRGTLAKIRSILTDDGLFFFDFGDLRLTALNRKKVASRFKIDHPYAFSDVAVEYMLAQNGFKVVEIRHKKGSRMMGYLCKKCPPNPAYKADMNKLLSCLRSAEDLKNRGL